jgi:hypothetical protein
VEVCHRGSLSDSPDAGTGGPVAVPPGLPVGSAARPSRFPWLREIV